VTAARAAVVVVTAAVAIAAVAATLLGADAARAPADSLARASAILERALREGPRSASVLRDVRELRARLGARPLDGRTRVAYASFLLELAEADDDLPAATFHARRAAAMAPVTVPVVRAASLVLARANAPAEALSLAREMFAYDPDDAAALLALIEPDVGEGSAANGVPDSPEAWIAWPRRLSRSGREDEARVWTERGLGRWPRHPGLLESAASRAASRGDWDAVLALLPPEEPIPDSASAAVLLAYRAQGRARRGDAAGAVDDARRATRLAAGNSWRLSLAGDAFLAAGALDEAGARWREALYRVRAGEDGNPMRVSLLGRLARLEERRHREGDALRAWRAVLKIEPGNDEARRRVAALTGGAR
jgi:tetratricopeptide (TPR) repeat protein